MPRAMKMLVTVLLLGLTGCGVTAKAPPGFVQSANTTNVFDDRVAGVWASDKATFYGTGMIHTGLAVYVRNDGLGVIAFGFPPLGVQVRLADVVDGEQMQCVMFDADAIRPCNSRVRIHQGVLEVSSHDSAIWEKLEKVSDSVSEAMREDFAWDQLDGDQPRDVTNRSLQSAIRLLSLPDFRESLSFLNAAEALNAFQLVYWGYLNNKAFAVTSGGVFGFNASGTKTKDAAINSALKYCETGRNKTSGVSECEVVNVNGEWIQ